MSELKSSMSRQERDIQVGERTLGGKQKWAKRVRKIIGEGGREEEEKRNENAFVWKEREKKISVTKTRDEKVFRRAGCGVSGEIIEVRNK